MDLKLESPVKAVKGVGEKTAGIFAKQGINTVFDLLFHFPLDYIDFSTPADGIDLQQKKVYRVEIENFRLSRIYWKKLTILNVNAKISTGTGPPKKEEKIRVVFFNKPYLSDFFRERTAPAADPGQAGKKTPLDNGLSANTGEKNSSVYLYGQMEKKPGFFQLSSPMVFSGTGMPAVQPLYHAISTIKNGTLRKLMGNIFAVLEDDCECLPPWILEKYGFPAIAAALSGIHLPAQYNPGVIDRLKSRFIYREFLFFQLELQYTRNFFKKVKRLNHYVIDRKVKQSVDANVEFELTADQVKAYADIVNDLKSDFAMQRLLQGDVGSGKTIIAFLALLLARENGFQGAFLAPTEILTNQHFSSAKRFFKDAEVEVLTGSTPPAARARIYERLLAGEIDIIFGTHSLLNENVRFKNLSLVVIDEQHRFGVSQRAALYYKGLSVDLLVTTATPIPRTMLLSLYNDLSVSLIETKPRGRLPIITKIVANRARDEFYRRLKGKVEQGNKVYIILPLVEESEFFAELRSIEKETPYFKEVFVGLPMGIVSGRTPADRKDKTLAEFAAGKIEILVSTTVIEVGIDVKDATIIVIEDADRYGLSQLHQLRGRVGRGGQQSFCYLIPSVNISESGKQRLLTTASTDDGFKIAEIDLEMRGGGIITGLEQSGYLDFRIGDVKRDREVFAAARRDAASMLQDESLLNGHSARFLEQVKQKTRSINFS
ncbi:MAG: ATP-dependent DNA helicase RecG [Candidatus Aminicenantes bacterium]|nr:ATP-dependent DNA helicase RecG [Candidatus Aminicenantes bacterium]